MTIKPYLSDDRKIQFVVHAETEEDYILLRLFAIQEINAL